MKDTVYIAPPDRKPLAPILCGEIFILIKLIDFASTKETCVVNTRFHIRGLQIAILLR